LRGSTSKLVHVCGHIAKLPHISAVHAPRTQTSLEAHSLPQEPQLALSAVVSTQIALQAISLVGHGMST